MWIRAKCEEEAPFRSEKCEDPEKCMVCEGKKGRCRSAGVTYEVRCKKCGDNTSILTASDYICFMVVFRQ